MPSQPVQIADRVHWVGTRLPDDRFQAHAYLIENGSDSILVDPGSVLTIEDTLASVQLVLPLSDLRWIVCHHADPDVVGALPVLSDLITRQDARVVTEWRAAALLKHYGHRFGYYLVEENGWSVPLDDGRLEFQLTPYLHFPGALVSFDTRTRTLFSGDIFGGFVPDNGQLVSADVEYIIENARPFHQHYMPSRELLEAGLNRVQSRWPQIDRIAPQHGHIVDTSAVEPTFRALKGIECGVFALADADLDLQRLLRISQARVQITDAVLTETDPPSLVRALNRILRTTDDARECALYIDVPERGWTAWSGSTQEPTRSEPTTTWPAIELPGSPAAVLAILGSANGSGDADLLEMLGGLADTVRLVVDHYLRERAQTQRVADLRRAALTDPLTSLGNRRALEEALPSGGYATIALDLDHFKRVNDEFGHLAGDTVLTRVAGAVAGAIRDDDKAYRVGGEEFLIVLPGTGGPAALAVAERIRAAVAALDLDGVSPAGRMTVSMGVSIRSADSHLDFAAAVAGADDALYEAKRSGRDRVCMARPGLSSDTERVG